MAAPSHASDTPLVADEPPSSWRWPLLALLSWTACWGVWRLLGPGWPAALVAVGLGLMLAGLHRQRWRRFIVAGGFPLALLATGVALPAWSWLIALGLLLLAYPRRGWSDAPLYPTPHHALSDLPRVVRLPDGARVLDAGCGLGDGLVALRRAYPVLQIEGIEYSPFLWLLARLRCRWACVRRGDLWRQSWADKDMVYVFQRPESMPKVLEKARTEMRSGSWLVSLDFPIPGQPPYAQLQTGSRHQLYVYRIRDLRL